MRFMLFLSVILFSFPLIAIDQTTPNVTLILNMLNGQDLLPPQFRTAQDPFKTTTPILPSRYGLGDLRLSGSAQFSEDALNKILTTINKDRVLIVDLREESHGFVNGNAVSWFADRDWANRGKTLVQIQKDEDDKLSKLYMEQFIIVQKVLIKNANGGISSSEPLKIKVTKVQTEAELCRKLHCDSLRIPVTDHLPPTDDAVEKFLTMIKGLDTKTWVHFHCAAGDGRTTTFMSMFDIYYNARNVSFEDIIERQWRIGGINLNNLPPVGTWKYAGIKSRIIFLKQFYDFCLAGGGNWTTWHNKVKGA